MKTKTQTMKHTIWAGALVLMMGLAAQTAHAGAPAADIAAQGHSALTAIQAELRAGMPRASRPDVQGDEVGVVRAVVDDTIRRQGRQALRAIAWETEAELHIGSRVAADARPSRGGYVTVTAPMHFGAPGTDGS